jgi:hypothetical protein
LLLLLREVFIGQRKRKEGRGHGDGKGYRNVRKVRLRESIRNNVLGAGEIRESCCEFGKE